MNGGGLTSGQACELPWGGAPCPKSEGAVAVARKQELDTVDIDSRSRKFVAVLRAIGRGTKFQQMERIPMLSSPLGGTLVGAMPEPVNSQLVPPA